MVTCDTRCSLTLDEKELLDSTKDFKTSSTYQRAVFYGTLMFKESCSEKFARYMKENIPGTDGKMIPSVTRRRIEGYPVEYKISCPYSAPSLEDEILFRSTGKKPLSGEREMSNFEASSAFLMVLESLKKPTKFQKDLIKELKEDLKRAKEKISSSL